MMKKSELIKLIKEEIRDQLVENPLGRGPMMKARIENTRKKVQGLPDLSDDAKIVLLGVLGMIEALSGDITRLSTPKNQ